MHNDRSTLRVSRRTALAAVPVAMAAGFAAAQPPARRARIAAVVTIFRRRSHGENIVDRFLEGFGWEGEHHRPAVDVVSLYVDQVGADDLSRERASRIPGLTIYPSIAQALCAGGDRLAVDGVMLIGEHGDYPTNEKGQTLYPRYEFFRQIVDVFVRSRQSVPVFNDKHLSWSWEHAREMYDWSRDLGFTLMAGSSLPVTWRMPSIDLPLGAEVEEVLGLGFGGVDSYDFHVLEAMQCLAEQRAGGESGVVSMQASRGDTVWGAIHGGDWDSGGLDSRLLEACLCRSHMLAPSREGFNHIYPTPDEIRRLAPNPVAYRFQYADGLKATMLLADGLVSDMTVALRLKGESEPFSLMFYLGRGSEIQPNYFNALSRHIETMFTTGRTPYPIERTLLTTGLVAAGVESLFQGKAIDTLHLAISYKPRSESTFRQS